MDVFTENRAILLGEVDMLEKAVGGLDCAGGYEESAGYSAFVQGYDFAGFDFADEMGIDSVQGAGFACGDVSAGVGFAYAEGSNAIRVASGLDMVGEKE